MGMRSLLLLIVVVCTTSKAQNVPALVATYPESGTTVDYDSTLTMSCVGYGTPLPTITWFRNGLALSNLSPDVFVNASTLQRNGKNYTLSQIEICPLRNGGNYSCAATNTVRTHTVYFQVTVARNIAEIVVHPSSEISSDYDSSLTLSCVGYGNPLPTILWFRDGVLLSNMSSDITINASTLHQNNRDFAVSHIQICPLQIGGNYSCAAMNTVRTHTVYFQVTAVKPIPAEIVVHPSSEISSKYNNSLTLSCVGYGIPLPTISWFRNGVLLSNLSSSVSINVSTLQQASRDFVFSQLDICPLQIGGNYSCRASNANGTQTVYFQVTVIQDIPAEIVLRPEASISEDYNSSISVGCVGYGHPLPDISWSRNGVPITNLTLGSNIYEATIQQQNLSFTRSILEICPLQQGGNYSCEANNTNGTSEVFFQLTVLRAVRIAVISPDTNATAGGTVSLPCTASGVPPPTIVWSRQGNPLTSRTFNITENSFTGQSNQYTLSVLHLCDLQLADFGQYTCTASNRINEGLFTNTSSLQLQVHAPPNITSPPQNQSVTEGGRVELICTVASAPLSEVEWRFVDASGGERVIAASNTALISTVPQNSTAVISNLTLLSIQYSSEGVYVCSATSTLGNDTASATLNVFAPSSFLLLPPANQSVLNGTSISIGCVARGQPLPTISWFKGNTLITSGMEFNVSAQQLSPIISMSTLTLCDVHLVYSGAYMCRAENSLVSGSQTFSNAVTHTVSISLLIPSLITTPPINLSVTANATVELTCTVFGSPLPVVEWRFTDGNGERVVTETNSALISTVVLNETTATSNLTLLRVPYSKEGVYVCSATNSYGNDTASAMLNVFDPSSFLLLPPANQSVLNGTSISIVCVARGQPLPTISWFKGNTLITSGMEFNVSAQELSPIISMSTLTLCDVHLVYSGAYMCRAENSLVSGSQTFSNAVTHTISISLLIPSLITTPPINLSVTANATVELTCTVFGNPLPVVEWRFMDGNGERVVTETNSALISTVVLNETTATSNLTLLSVQYSREGVYVCSATNSYGNDTASATLNVFVPSSFRVVPPDLTAVPIGNSFYLSCVAQGQPLPTISWTFQGSPITSGTLLNITASQLNRITALSILNLCDVELVHAGQYACTAGNSYSQAVFSSTITEEFNISLLLPSNITVPPLTQSVPEGARVELTCTVSGPPLPEVEWRFVDDAGEQVVTPDSSTLISTVPDRSNLTATSNLTLLRVPYTREGVYVCSATNSIGNDTASARVYVYIWSSFLAVPPDTQAVPIGDRNFFLDCIAHGHPLPTISWSKEGTPITSGMGFNITVSQLNVTTIISSLHFDRVELYHSGEYACRVENSLTVDSRLEFFNYFTEVFNISLLLPSSITIPPLNQSVTEGDTVELTCTVSGPPLPEVEWRFVDEAGERVVMTDNITLITTVPDGSNLTVTSNLTFLSVPYSREGVYVCSATNTLGNDTASARLNVYVASSFRVVPPDVTAIPIGDSFYLSCVAQGQPLPTISWTFQGSPITSGTLLNITASQLNRITALSILNLCDVQLIHAGEYACTARNSLIVDSQMFSNMVTKGINISLLLPSNITIPPLNQLVTEGDRVELTCTVSGPPLPDVKWRFVDDTGEQVVTPDSSTLITTATDGRNMTVTSNLTLLSVSYSREGVYVCSAMNAIGNDTASARLYVFAPSSLRAVPPDTQAVPIGERNFFLDCIARGQPLPTISWSREGTPITSGMGFTITESRLNRTTTMSVLRFDRVELYHPGEYACTAQNSLTVDSQLLSNVISEVFNISLLLPSSITIPPLNQSVTEGDTVELTCTVSGPPLPEVEWRFVDDAGERVVTPDSSTLITTAPDRTNLAVISNLTLLSVAYSREGVYVCSATNSVGNDSAVVTLYVFAPSSFQMVPSPDSSVAIDDRNFLVECVARGQPLPTISWSSGGLPIAIGMEFNITEHQPGAVTITSTLQLYDLQLDYSGEYACMAENSFSNASQTLFSNMVTHEFNISVLASPVISLHPSPAEEEVVAGATVFRSCVAIGNPRPTITWLKDGVAVTQNEVFLMAEEQRDQFNVSSILHIGPSISASAGVYQCLVNGVSPDGSTSLVYSNTSEIIFTSPPHILEMPSNVAIFVSMEVTFSCTFESSPLPTRIDWTLRRNGTMPPIPLIHSQSISIVNTPRGTNMTSLLTLRAPTERDAGEYTCTAFNGITTNLIGARDTGSASLFFRTDDPFLVAQPSNGVFYVGESAILECAGGSTTTLTVTWTKNGRPFQPNTSTAAHEQVYTRNILFPVLRDADNGVYICTAASQQYRRNVTTRSATLTVFTPVSILESPANATVNASTTLTWSCLVQGSHDVRVSWMNGSSQVVPDGSRVEITVQRVNNTFRRSSLRIQNVAVTDSALYSCNTSNVLPVNASFASTESRYFTLFVQRPPLILSPNGTRAVALDGSLAETLLFRITQDVPLVQDNAVITNFTRYDGTPFPRSSVKNGSEITFSLSSVNIRFDEGNYSVFVSNPGGSYHKVVYLDVQSPPVMLGLEVSGEVQVRRMNYVAVEGRRVVLTCSFLADPRPTVTWQLNGVNISTHQARRYSVQKTFESIGPIGNYTERLTILSAAERDEGNYTCLGENIHSNSNQPVMDIQPVEVIVPPTVTPLERSPIGVETRDGRPSQITVGFTITRADPAVVLDNITLTYSNRSHSNMDLTMLAMINSKFQLSADLLTLTISDLSYFDAGSITLTAFNEAGTGSDTIQLDVHVEPNLLNETTHFNETLVEGETAVFSCFADGYPLPNIVWLHNGSFVATSSSTRRMVSLSDPTTSPERDYIQAHNSTLEVPRLRLREAGEYLCRVDPANIDRGTSVLSDSLDLTVLPAPIDYCTPDPCVNGVCSNQSSTYLCTCVPVTMWRGINCSIEIFQFEEVEVVTDPELSDFPQLFRPVALTCGVEGIPEPNITWYKDGVLLEGERSRTFVIQEVEITDRGLYWCRGENFDPNNQNRFEDVSEEAAVNIKGIAQYSAKVIVKSAFPRSRRQAVNREVNTLNSFISRLSGLEIDGNSTILSVVNTTEVLADEETTILITLLASNGGSAELTETLAMRMNITADAVEGLDLAEPPIRFDGCEEDTIILPALEPGGLEVVLEWREADLGEVLTIQCPCGNLSALGGGNFERTASRRCGGNFTAGAVWDDGMIAACNFSVATRQLCQIANVIGETDTAISELDRITSQQDDIGVDEFSVTTVLIEAVSTGVEQDRNLTEGLFEVVDNLLAVDPESIQASQEESNTTARILDVVEQVAQSIPIPENETSSTIQLESFAVAVMEVRDKSDFDGQTFSVSLGDKFTSENPDDLSLDSDDVSFKMVETTPTASLQITREFFEDKSVADAISAAGGSGNSSSDADEDFVPRIINSVYLSDALFPRIGNNESDVSTAPVGSIILSSTLTVSSSARATSKEVRVTNINPPITLTFEKKPSFFKDTNADTTCNYWDFKANKGLGDWSTMNCTLVSDNADPKAVCQCTHFTNFAILLDPNPVERTVPTPVEDFLSALSYIGVVVSIACLILTVVTYLTSKKLRTSEAGQLLLHLSFGLLGVYILFILCLQATFNKYACAVAGGLLHYFLLVSFFLMAAEAINLFVKLVIVLGIPAIIKNRYVLKASLISWITPLVIVIVSEAPDYTNYVSDVFCRPYGPAFYGGLVAPFGVIYLFNWGVFLAIIISFLRKKKIKSGKKGEKSKLKQQFVIAITLSALFGLGWGFGFAATSSIPVLSVATIIQALFIVLTSFQGFLIFIMQCLRSEDARNEWKRWITTLSCNKIKFEAKKKKHGTFSSSVGRGTLSTSYSRSSISSSSRDSKKIKPKRALRSVNSGYLIDSNRALAPSGSIASSGIKFKRDSSEDLSNFSFGRSTFAINTVGIGDEEKLAFEMQVRSEDKHPTILEENEAASVDEASVDGVCMDDEAFEPSYDEAFQPTSDDDDGEYFQPPANDDAFLFTGDEIDFVPFNPDAQLGDIVPNAKFNPIYGHSHSKAGAGDVSNLNSAAFDSLANHDQSKHNPVKRNPVSSAANEDSSSESEAETSSASDEDLDPADGPDTDAASDDLVPYDHDARNTLIPFDSSTLKFTSPFGALTKDRIDKKKGHHAAAANWSDAADNEMILMNREAMSEEERRAGDWGDVTDVMASFTADDFFTTQESDVFY